MLVRTLLVCAYVIQCIRFRALPWKYFQLNADYFNEELGVFSKLDIDSSIPEKWRLKQWLDNDTISPSFYPVFIKPIWGQNSKGVACIDNKQALLNYRDTHKNNTLIIQEAATGALEYEIFYVPQVNNFSSLLSITEVTNNSNTRHPINSIYNKSTLYRDITNELSEEELHQIEEHILALEAYKICRVSVKADNIEQLLRQDFKVIEINIYIPMALMLLSTNVNALAKLKFIHQLSTRLALHTALIDKKQKVKSIFFKKINTESFLRSKQS